MPYLQPGAGDARFDQYIEEMKFEQKQPTTVHPVEMEQGRIVPSDPLKDYLEKRTYCEKHRTMFACCGVFVPFMLLCGILAAIFYPKKPLISLFSSSQLDIDGFNGANANFVIRIENPNHYKLTFSDLTAEVFDYDYNILGTINRPENFEVAKRSSGFMTATGAFRDDLVQVGMVGLNCLNNGGETLMQLKAQAKLSSFGGNRRISKTTGERVQCTVRNVAGGGNTPGRWTPVPGAVAPVVPRPRGNNPAVPAAPMAPVAPVQPRPNAGNPAAPFPQPGAGNNPPFPQAGAGNNPPFPPNGAPFPQNGAPFQPNAPFQGGAPPRQGAPFQPGGGSMGGGFPPASFPPNGNAFPPGGVNQNPNAIGQPMGNGQPNGNGFGGNGMGGGVRGAP